MNVQPEDLVCYVSMEVYEKYTKLNYYAAIFPNNRIGLWHGSCARLGERWETDYDAKINRQNHDLYITYEIVEVDPEDRIVYFEVVK